MKRRNLWLPILLIFPIGLTHSQILFASPFCYELSSDSRRLELEHNFGNSSLDRFVLIADQFTQPTVGQILAQEFFKQVAATPFTGFQKTRVGFSQASMQESAQARIEGAELQALVAGAGKRRSGKTVAGSLTPFVAFTEKNGTTSELAEANSELLAKQRSGLSLKGVFARFHGFLNGSLLPKSSRAEIASILRFLENKATLDAELYGHLLRLYGTFWDVANRRVHVSTRVEKEDQLQLVARSDFEISEKNGLTIWEDPTMLGQPNWFLRFQNQEFHGRSNNLESMMFAGLLDLLIWKLQKDLSSTQNIAGTFRNSSLESYFTNLAQSLKPINPEQSYLQFLSWSVYARLLPFARLAGLVDSSDGAASSTDGVHQGEKDLAALAKKFVLDPSTYAKMMKAMQTVVEPYFHWYSFTDQAARFQVPSQLGLNFVLNDELNGFMALRLQNAWTEPQQVTAIHRAREIVVVPTSVTSLLRDLFESAMSN